MVTTLEDAKGSRTPTVGETVRAFLDEHPDVAHRPTHIAEELGVPIGSAKRQAKTWRDGQKLSLLGPVYLQNVRLVTRTPQARPTPVRPPPDGRTAGTTSSRAPSTSRRRAAWSSAGPRTARSRSGSPHPGA